VYISSVNYNKISTKLFRSETGACEVDPALMPKLESVWSALQKITGKSQPMEDKLYEHVVAL
jgi:hypothetical protein